MLLKLVLLNKVQIIKTDPIFNVNNCKRWVCIEWVRCRAGRNYTRRTTGRFLTWPRQRPASSTLSTPPEWNDTFLSRSRRSWSRTAWPVWETRSWLWPEWAVDRSSWNIGTDSRPCLAFCCDLGSLIRCWPGSQRIFEPVDSDGRLDSTPARRRSKLWLGCAAWGFQPQIFAWIHDSKMSDSTELNYFLADPETKAFYFTQMLI